MKGPPFFLLVVFLITPTLAACSSSDLQSVADLPALPSENVDLSLIPQDLAGSEPTPEGTMRDALRFEDAGFDYISKYLLDPTEELHNFIVKDEFSRCPSGASYYLESKPSDEVPFYMGTVSFSQGCGTGQDFLDFRVSPDGQTLEISDIEKNSYVPYKTWFETAKPIF